MLYRNWKVENPDSEAVAKLQQALGESELLCRVLVARGYDTPETALSFLDGDTELPDPFLIPGLAKAVERIQQAIDQDEAIVIFGDYDVDGITSTALLYTYLEAAGATVYYKLPNRSDDGYGLLPPAVEQIASHGISLIITVDNGTSAVEAAECANSLGVDIVVTDHHLPPEQLPPAYALVNPHCGEPGLYQCLSGVGVTFMLAAGLEGCPPEELLPLFGDLVAIGTVADVMRLQGVNRKLVRAGLAVLQDTQRPGLAALIQECGWGDKGVSVENISYGIAPRLNAAGRMDDATNALRLLLADTEEEALPIVEILQEQNAARQKTEQEIVAAISEEIEQQPEQQRARVLVVGGDGWHQGIIGIVASRLVDKFAKPAIVVSFDGDEGRGSGRSISGFSLYGAIASCADILVRFGGHDLAAGLSIEREKMEEFRSRVNEWALENYPVLLLPELKADSAVDLEKIDVEDVRSLERLSPCGSGNPSPKFLLSQATIDGVYPISEGRHSRIRLRQSGRMLYAVLFGTGPEQLLYKVGDTVDALVALSVYEGKGEAQISARLLEMRPAGLGSEHVEQSALYESFVSGGMLTTEQRKKLYPSREDTALLYRALRSGAVFGTQDLRPVFALMGEQATGCALTALAVLEEMGLVRQDENGVYKLLQVAGKKDLSNSALLKRLEV